MTDSKNEPKQWAKHAAEKLAAKEWLAVYISGAGFVISALLTIISVAVSLVAIFIAVSATQSDDNQKKTITLWQTYVVELQQVMIEEGLEVPEPPPILGEYDVESEEESVN